jgi:hypothetical protein
VSAPNLLTEVKEGWFEISALLLRLLFLSHLNASLMELMSSNYRQVTQTELDEFPAAKLAFQKGQDNRCRGWRSTPYAYPGNIMGVTQLTCSSPGNARGEN